MFTNVATQANRHSTFEVGFINCITALDNLKIVFTHHEKEVSPVFINL